MAAPTQVSYIILPHPDDEYSTWSLITGASGNYKVFIYMTQGEETGLCHTSNDAKNGYQGPSSPNGQPNYGEINPLGTGTNIWVGRWTATCKSARRAGTLNFLRDKAAGDSSIPNGFSDRGIYSFPGNTLAGVPPRREDNTTIVTSRNSWVYDASNGMGKVIFFDLGDGDLKAEEVEWAIRSVRQNKGTLGIPALPEYNAVGAFSHLGQYSGCELYDHGDHRAVHVALWNYDMINGRQHARTCSTDPDVDDPRTKSMTTTEHNAVKAGSLTTRVGPFQRRYGWLTPTWWYFGWATSNEIRSRTQHFWSRFN